MATLQNCDGVLNDLSRNADRQQYLLSENEARRHGAMRTWTAVWTGSRGGSAMRGLHGEIALRSLPIMCPSGSPPRSPSSLAAGAFSPLIFPPWEKLVATWFAALT